MPAIYTLGGDTLNENILLKIFAFDDSASDARTPCIARGWEKVRRGPPLFIADEVGRDTGRGAPLSWTTSDIAISPDNATIAVANNFFMSPPLLFLPRARSYSPALWTRS